ncbi:MAG TPA: ATP-binding protein [Steroidobacter sp.]|uniref:ATP-binding protein n=1 Tax=Steroidobacter sp. TaxID=1978227 RepID=UPI002EDB6DC0
MPISTAELSWRVLGFVNGLRLLAASALATLFFSIMPETVGQLDPALFAGAATAYFLYAGISVGSIRRRAPDIVLQTWTGVFADVLVLSLLTYASGGVNGGISALVVLSIGAASFILRRRLAIAIAISAALAMLVQPGITLLASTDAVGDFTTAAISGALTIVISLGISQLSRVMRSNEEISRQREAANSDLMDLHRALTEHLQEGVLVVDGENRVTMISDTASTMLQGGAASQGLTLGSISPRLFNLLDVWRRSFCDESRSTPTMTGFDGERRLQLKFVSLDNSVQGPALIFVEDKSRVSAWLSAAMVPASVQVNQVPVPREPAPQAPPPPPPVRAPAPSFQSPYAAGAVREPSYEGGPYAGSLAPVSALRSSEPRGNPFEEPAFREGPRRQSPSRVEAARPDLFQEAAPEEEDQLGDYRANTLRENLARQNNFRAALQEVSPWANAPKPPAPPARPPTSANTGAQSRRPQQQQPVRPPTASNTVAQTRRPQPQQQQQPARPPGSMLTNNDPRLRIIIGNALQFGRRESVRLERVDLASWCKEFLTEFWQAEEIDADTLRLSAPRESVPVRADPAHLQRLLWTLCTDLLKYGRASNSTDPVEIRVGRSATTQRRYLDVIDRGSAIGPADSKRVFEPFLSAGKAGTGISMFVSRELSPGVRSGANNDPRPGGGVVFRLVFAEVIAPKPVEAADE